MRIITNQEMTNKKVELMSFGYSFKEATIKLNKKYTTKNRLLRE